MPSIPTTAAADADAAANAVPGVAINGATPLHMAVVAGDIEMAQALIAGNANIECLTNEGYTPLHIAAIRGDAAMLRALVAAKANIEGRTPQGETALVLAVKFEGLMKKHADTAVRAAA